MATGICDRCHASVPLIHRHHIDGNAGNDSPGNIELLCPKCHGETRKGGRHCMVKGNLGKAKICKMGNSAGILLPRGFLRRSGLGVGDIVAVLFNSEELRVIMVE